MTRRLEALMNRKAWNASKPTGQRPPSMIDVVEHMRDLQTEGYYEEVLELSSRYPELQSLPETHNVVGLALLGLNRTDEAREQFEAAASELRLRLAGTFSNLVAIHVKRGDLQAAEQYAIKARRLAPKWNATHLNLMAVYNCWDKPSLVRKTIEEMTDFYPDWQSDDELWNTLRRDIDLRGVEKLIKDYLGEQ